MILDVQNYWEIDDYWMCAKFSWTYVNNLYFNVAGKMKNEKKPEQESADEMSVVKVKIEGEESDDLEKYSSGLYNKNYINLTSII